MACETTSHMTCDGGMSRPRDVPGYLIDQELVAYRGDHGIVKSGRAGRPDSLNDQITYRYQMTLLEDAVRMKKNTLRDRNDNNDGDGKRKN